MSLNLKINKIEEYLNVRAEHSVLYSKGQSIHPIACGIAIAVIWDMFMDLDDDKKRGWYNRLSSPQSYNAQEGP